MNDVLQSYLEQRRTERSAESDADESTQLVKELVSNTGLLLQNSKSQVSLGKKVLGAVESQTAIQAQRDSIYKQFSKEQLGGFYEFSDYQRQQTKTLSKNLREFSKTLREAIGAGLDETNKSLSTLVDILKPNVPRDKQRNKDLAEAIAEALAGAKTKKNPKDAKATESLVSDVGDLFDLGERKGRRGRRGGRGRGRTSRGGRSMGSPRGGGGSRLPAGGSWWDKVKAKVPSKVPGAGAGKALFRAMPHAAKLGMVAAPLAAGAMAVADAGMGVKDLADGKRQTEMPKGWDMLSPMRWGMYGGEKINQGTEKLLGRSLGSALYDITHGEGPEVEAVKKLAATTASSLSSATDKMSSLGPEVAHVLNTSVVPGFQNAITNLGSFSESFKESASTLLDGLGKNLDQVGNNVKQAYVASAAFARKAATETVEKGKKAVEATSKAVSQGADRAVQVVTGDKNATVGSATAAIRERGSAAMDSVSKLVSGLGSTSAMYESGKQGTKAVGWDPTGGTSYGKYQIASKVGAATEFLEYVKKSGSDNSDIYSTLKEAGFEKDTGSRKGAAVDAWKKLASSQSSAERLSELEHNFIRDKKFMPAYNKAKELGFATDNAGVQDAIWSAAVQHGRVNSQILEKVAKMPGFAEMTPQDQIKAMYDRRSEYVAGLKNVSQSAGKDRYDREVKTALAKSTQETPLETNATKLAKSTQEAPLETNATKLATSAKETSPEVSASKVALGGVTPPSREGSSVAPSASLASATPEVAASKPALVGGESATPAVSYKRDRIALADASLPPESAPVSITNADQVRSPAPLIESQGGGSMTGTGGVVTPMLDDIPMHITDMGLVLVQMGHI